MRRLLPLVSCYRLRKVLQPCGIESVSSVTCKAVTSAGGGFAERAKFSSLRRFEVAI